MQSTRLSLTNRLLCSGVIVLLMLLGSCGVVPKNAPVGKPFVFKYTVTVDGNFSPAEKSNLETRLARQLDDSIRVRTVRKLIYKGVNRPVLDKPPVYDPSNAERSKVFMRALLVSLGYFKDTITDNAVFDTISAEEIRTTVNFIVKPGNAVTIDSFRYNLSDSNLQKLAVSTQGQALIKKGEAFAKTSISSELDRLVELYRNNGYMKFGREELYGLWDTLDVSLLKPVTDPFEQLELLQKLQARKDSLKANLEIRLRPNADTVKLRQYKVGNIYLFPEHTPLEARGKFVQVAPGVFVDTVQRVFVPKIFPPYLYLKTGDIYDQRNFVRTINRFNQLGSWRMVAIDQNIRSGTDTSDFSIRLTPAKKYSFTANLEGSRNENAVSGNLFGIGVNFSLQNRNFARRANIANTSIRVGVETGRDKAAGINFIQTKQLSATHTIYFPRAIFPYNKIFNAGTQATSRTVLSLSGALTERRALYNLNTANLAYGIDFRWGTTDMSIRWPNVEYSSFTSQPRLDTIFSRNPSLRNVFTDGLIVSAKVGAVHNEIRDKRVSVIRGNLEISGIPGLRNNFFDTNLYRFVKLDAEYIQKTKLGKNDLVFRFFAGVGNELTSTVAPTKKYNLPFFRQYFAGGPNSMRAWGLRRLGPGSLIRNFDTTGVPDRYGDMQLETNLEYRFKLVNLFGMPLNGAVFTDIGNIWLLRKPPGGYDETVFSLNRLAKDLAVGMGFGIRADFSILVVRLDFSHKVKDPSPTVEKAYLQNKWFGYLGSKESPLKYSQFQLGISYPFIR